MWVCLPVRRSVAGLLQLVAFCTQPAGMAAARLPSVRLLICQLAGFGQTRQKEKTLKTVLWI